MISVKEFVKLINEYRKSNKKRDNAKIKIKCKDCGNVVNVHRKYIRKIVRALNIDEVDLIYVYRCEPCRRRYLDGTNFSWIGISQFKELPEKFIEKYKDKVDWWVISRFRNLSPEFIVKHIDKIRESIFLNRRVMSTLPDTIKLLLKMKFNKL